MSVSLRPSSSLGFNRPLTQLVKRVLTITNNNDQPVAFKVKTTAPKLYCVRPNSGRIDPGSSEEVQVMLQAMKEEPPSNVKCKDKFLVQSTIITPEKESMSLSDLWSNIDDKDGSVHQQKIKVVYLPGVGQELPEEDEAPSGFVNDSRYQTVREVPNGHADDSMSQPHFPDEPHDPLERAFSPPVGDYSVPAEEEEISMPVPHPPPRQHTPPAAMQQQHSSASEDEMRSQLAAAQAEIDRLRQLLSSVPELSSGTELRRRNLRALSDDATTAVSTSGETDAATTVVETAVVHTDGVAPFTVLGISFVVFILTYMFF